MWFFESLGWETPGVSGAMRKLTIFPGTAPWASPRLGDNIFLNSLKWEVPGVSLAMRKVWGYPRYGPLGLPSGTP